MNLTKTESAIVLIMFLDKVKEKDINNYISDDHMDKLAAIIPEITGDLTVKESKLIAPNLIKRLIADILEYEEDLPTRLEGSD